MNVATMRKLDGWLGGAACAALTVARRLLDWRSSPDRPVRRIAFIKLAEQGATVLAHSALRQAVERVGRANVYFVVFEENRFILDVMEVIPPDNVIAIRTDGMVRLVGDALRAVSRLRRLRVDAAIDFEFFARSSAALAFLSGADRRVGFHAFHGEAAYRGDLMTHRVSFNPHLHASQQFQLLLAALDQPPEKLPALDMTPAAEDLPLPAFRPSDAERETVREMLRRALNRDSLPPLILLNANCSDLLPLRRWPTERYVALARRLLQRYPQIGIAFTGAPAEQPGVRQLLETLGSDRCVSMAGKTTLRQLLVLYCLAEVLVTNDSGPAHFATLTPIDVVTLFGPETPAAFGARTPHSHILFAGIVCSPCVNANNDRQSACADNACMQRISVDEVFDTVCAAYDRRRAAGAPAVLAAATREAAGMVAPAVSPTPPAGAAAPTTPRGD
jgi:ADP-heptose:LPS heptosyltransferase